MFASEKLFKKSIRESLYVSIREIFKKRVSENFFKNYRRTNKNRNRGLYPFKRTPSYYNAVEEGLVTPVQDQGVCLSCVAFATIAMLETCLAKKLGMYVFIGNIYSKSDAMKINIELLN